MTQPLVRGFKPTGPVEEAFARARRIADRVGVPQEGFSFSGPQRFYTYGAYYSAYLTISDAKLIHGKWEAAILKAFGKF